MDHYKVLGVSRTATKDEIKQAFRKLALQFHPDKHSHSPKHLKDSAILQFKLLSEAYDVLSDDSKRADYNIRQNGTRYSRSYYNAGGGASGTSGFANNYGYGYGYSSSKGPSYSYYRTCDISKFEVFMKYLTSRSFLLHAAFASALLGGMYVVDAGEKALWKMYNPGKSFEEAMESIEKAKAFKDDA